MKRTPSEGYNEYQMQTYARFGVLISVFVDPNHPDDFIAGYVQALTKRHVLLSAVSPFGRYDGLIALRLNDIQMVIGEDDYALRLRMLLMARGEVRPDFQVEPEEDLMHAVCRFGLEKGEVVTVWTHDKEFCGIVTSLDDMRVTMQALDYFGQNPVSESVVLREIEMASAGTEDDKMFTLLHRQNTSTIQ